MCFLSETVPWNFEKTHPKSILHLVHLVDPTQIFFPRNFIQQQLMEGSVLFQSRLLGIMDENEIKMLCAQVWAKVIVFFLGPIQKYGLILGFQLSWIYWRAGEQIQECVHSAQSLLPTSAGLVSHPLCDTLAITSSPLAPLHTGLWFGTILLTTLLTKQCS